MKKILILSLMLMLGSVSFAMADDTTGGAWVIQLNGDTGFATGNLAKNVNQGWGGEGSIGYRFPSNILLAVESGFDTYSAKNGTFNAQWNMVPLIAKIQSCFGTGMVKPYLFVGGGLAFNSSTASAFGVSGTTTETDFLGEAGLGFDFAVAENVALFVQGKVEMDTTSKNYSSDVPTVLIPINAGFKFALN